MAIGERRFELKLQNRNVPDSELLEDVRRVSEVLGGSTPKLLQYRTHGKYHDSTLCARFGSWDDVLKKAGFQGAEHKMNVSNDELFQNIETVWISLGRQPTRRDMVSPLSKYSESPYRNRFGGWANALKEFVQWVDKGETGPSSESALQGQIKRSSRDPNLRLRFKVMVKNKFRCVKCGNSPAGDSTCTLHVDHILPWSLGGETIIENLQTLCATCNLGKSNWAEQ